MNINKWITKFNKIFKILQKQFTNLPISFSIKTTLSARAWKFLINYTCSKPITTFVSTHFELVNNLWFNKPQKCAHHKKIIKFRFWKPWDCLEVDFLFELNECTNQPTSKIQSEHLVKFNTIELKILERFQGDVRPYIIIVLVGKKN